MNPVISVIIPVYNRSLFLQDCFQSVVKQSYRPIEVIVVNDGSTDNTLEVIEQFQRDQTTNDFQVKIINQENSGAPSARNNGILHSTGEYIQFLDSDDYLAPEKLAEQLIELQSEKLDMVYSQAQHVHEDGSPINEYWGKPLEGTSNDYFEFSWQTMCPLFTRKAIDEIGLWNTELIINQDWDYCIRTILSGVKLKYIPKVHAFFRTHEHGNIGSGLNFEKIKSKEISTTTIYNLVKEKSLLDKNLKIKFLKRYLYCLLQYSDLKEKQAVNSLLKHIKKESFFVYLFLLPFKLSFLSKFFLKLYNSNK